MVGTHERYLSDLLSPYSLTGITQQIKKCKEVPLYAILGCQLDICNMDFVMTYSGALIRA